MQASENTNNNNFADIGSIDERTFNRCLVWGTAHTYIDEIVFTIL